MDITPVVPQGRPIIDAYGDGGFRIAGQRIEGAVLINGLIASPWSVPPLDALEDVSFASLFDPDFAIEAVLLGTGPRFLRPPRRLRDALKARGLSIEAMDTGAACRTFNVLLSESRRVAAALYPVA